MKLFAVTVVASALACVQAVSIPVLEQTALIFGFDDSNLHSMFSSRGGRLDDDSMQSESLPRKHRVREGGTIMDKLREDKRFSKFVEILEEHRGLQDDLERSDKKVALFAPTNEAIRKFKESMSGGHRDSRSGFNSFHHRRDVDMDQLVRYHLVREHVCEEDLYDGMTLETDLKLKELNDNRQRVRVFKVKGNTVLNMYANVEQETEAENGCIMAINNVLVPPPDILDTLYFLPTKFSTFIAAIQKVGLQKDIERFKGVTAFVPPNAAWEGLGLHNLMYLFSDKGEKDLKKIVEYHIATKLLYADEMIEKEKMELNTRLKEEKLDLFIKKRRGSKMSCSKYGNDDDSFSFFRHSDDEKEPRQCPRDYIISLNDGEATVVFTDAIAENGNIHLINSVLIPDSVKLPHGEAI